MFPLDHLPYELKESVLAHISPESISNLLKTDKNLRSYYLFYGPFIGKLEKIRFSVYNCRVEDDILYGQDIRIEISTEDITQTFAITKSHHLWEAWGKPLRIKSTDSSIFRQIRLAKKIEIKEYEATGRESNKPYSFEVSKFLPKIRYTNEMELFLYESTSVKPIFDQLQTKTYKSFMFYLVQRAMTEEEADQVAQIFENHFDHCAQLFLQCPASKLLTRVTKINPRSCYLLKGDIDEFKASIRLLIDSGKRSNIICGFANLPELISQYEVVTQILNTSRRLTKIQENSVEFEKCVHLFTNGGKEETIDGRLYYRQDDDQRKIEFLAKSFHKMRPINGDWVMCMMAQIRINHDAPFLYFSQRSLAA